VPVFQVEMRWRCSACQTEILGRYKFCSTCGKPKNDEPFYDAEASASPGAAVTDPALLSLATAGRDWVCRFCQNHQSNLHDRCAGCGASRADGAAPARPQPQAAPVRPALSIDPEFASRASEQLYERAERRHNRRTLWFGAAVVAFVGLLIALAWVFGEHDVEAQVVGRSWAHTVVVERYRVVDGQGFSEDQPSGAFDVSERGTRHHHYDKVADGTTQESYSVRVSCGEDCRTTSVTCRSNDNGFKTCSGGDRVCSTRYCNETRHRTVTRYKSVSVSRSWYTWRAWQWAVQRQLVERGEEEPPRWPSDDEIALDRGCGPGERERSERKASYEVVFADEDAERHPYVPRGLDEFNALSLGTRKVVRVGGDQTQIVTRR